MTLRSKCSIGRRLEAQDSHIRAADVVAASVTLLLKAAADGPSTETAGHWKALSATDGSRKTVHDCSASGTTMTVSVSPSRQARER